MTLTERILSEVARLVRPVGPDELSLTPAREQDLAIRLMIRHEAEFSVATTGANGPLPGDVKHEQSWGVVEQVVATQLEEASQAAGPLMEKWAAATVDDYLCKLGPDDCRHRVPRVGVETDCAQCKGKGNVRCLNCDGAKTLTCSNCHGTGKVDCTHCQGTQKVSCNVCYGRGYKEKQPQYMNSDERQKTSNQVHQPFVRVPCSHCNGTGKVLCLMCGFGKVQCQRCGASGKVRCSVCKGTGEILCEACAATGKTHRIAWLECTTSSQVFPEVGGDDPEDEETFQERVPLQDYARLASTTGGVVLQEWARRLDQRITCYYRVSVPVNSADVKVRDQAFTIRAYGPQQDVYNFHGLADRLLENDLAELEQSVKAHGLLSPASKAPLTQAVTKFLDSEVNLQIVEGAAAGTDAPAAGQQNGMVSEDYAARALPAISSALTKLHGSFLLLAVAGVTMLSTVLFFLARNGALSGPPARRVVVLFLITAGLWFVAEFWGRRKLHGQLGQAVGKRLKGSLGKLWARYRMLCGAGFVIAWYVSSIAFQVELYFRYNTVISLLPLDSAGLWH